MINRTLLLAFLVAIIFMTIYKDTLDRPEAFTIRSTYNRSMRYLRYHAHPRITYIANAIINKVKWFIPGL